MEWSLDVIPRNDPDHTNAAHRCSSSNIQLTNDVLGFFEIA